MTSFKKDNMTRRRFIKNASGAVFCFACLPSWVLAEGVNSEKDFREKPAGNNGEQLVAVCGTYCGACPMYINNKPMDKEKVKKMFERYMGRPMNMNLDNFVCDGCLSGGHLAFHCSNCKMRLCAKDRPDVTRCSDCPDFPCSGLKNFTGDEKPHHHELLDNLKNLKRTGIRDWASYERERWTCPECSNPLSWYDPACSNCGANRSDKLFSLHEK